MTQQVVEYNVTDVAIEAMSKQYLPLTIYDLNNKEQFDVVHDARMIVRGKRVEVEKKRKDLKAESLAYGKKIDTEAKRIFSLLEPIEAHLFTEEKKVTDEQKRVKEEEGRIEKEKIRNRVDALGEYKLMLPFFEVAGMTDAEFDAKLADAKEVHEAELKRTKEEEEARDAEDARLAAEKIENDRIREEQEAKAKVLQDKEDALKAKEKALDDAKKAEAERKDREAFEIEAAKRAKEQAVKDATERAERDARLKKEAEEAEKMEKVRQEALKPDKEKLLDYAERIVNIPIPEVKDEVAEKIVGVAMIELARVADDIRDYMEEM